jgi:hypothetical protein
MKPIWACLLTATLSCAVSVSRAQLQRLPDPQPQHVFGGTVQNINVVWHNAGDNTVRAEIATQLYQASSATVVPLNKIVWKRLEILPQQTVLESAPLALPTVKAPTRFLVQWIVGTNQLSAPTDLLVYPTNLLNELKLLISGDEFGVFDPADRIKPLLRQSGIDFLDLGTVPLEKFRGRLALLGPFESSGQMRDDLPASIRKMASAGVAVVWIQPPPRPGDELKPSFNVLAAGKAAVVVVQPEMVASLCTNPQSRLNLVYFCKLALRPAPFSLPNFTSQP